MDQQSMHQVMLIANTSKDEQQIQLVIFSDISIHESNILSICSVSSSPSNCFFGTCWMCFEYKHDWSNAGVFRFWRITSWASISTSSDFMPQSAQTLIPGMYLLPIHLAPPRTLSSSSDTVQSTSYHIILSWQTFFHQTACCDVMGKLPTTLT